MTSASPNSKTLRVDLRLPSIDALFSRSDLTPLSPDFHPYSYESGMEYLADRLYADRRLKTVEATFVLPRNALTSTADGDVRAAVQRYSTAKIEATGIDVRGDISRGLRAMFLGIVALAILLLIAGGIENITNDTFVSRAIVTGLTIGAWVSLWFPIEMLFWSAWTHRYDRAVYERLRDMRFTLTTEHDPH